MIEAMERLKRLAVEADLALAGGEEQAEARRRNGPEDPGPGRGHVGKWPRKARLMIIPVRHGHCTWAGAMSSLTLRLFFGPEGRVTALLPSTAS